MIKKSHFVIKIFYLLFCKVSLIAGNWAALVFYVSHYFNTNGERENEGIEPQEIMHVVWATSLGRSVHYLELCWAGFESDSSLDIVQWSIYNISHWSQYRFSWTGFYIKKIHWPNCLRHFRQYYHGVQGRSRNWIIFSSLRVMCPGQACWWWWLVPTPDLEINTKLWSHSVTLRRTNNKWNKFWSFPKEFKEINLKIT